jgi:bifunctional NMN adenylyltransferase/nudix hydrolase
MDDVQMDADVRLNLAVMLGRFRIFHNGHKSVIDLALTKADRVLIGIGSANKSRDSKGNEFTAVEAEAMIRAVYPFGTPDGDRIVIRMIDDVLYDPEDLFWIMGVQRTVAEVVRTMNISATGKKARIGLIGFSKDSTSYYLKKFPQWSSISAPGYKQNGKIVSATDIRNSFFYSLNFGVDSINCICDHVPRQVAEYMESWAKIMPDILQGLRDEKAFLVDYIEDHKFRGPLDAEGKPKGLKYDPTHTTVDAILIQSGHVLLIRRKFNPGKDKRALPGGFVLPGEKVLDAMLRELKEETKIGLSKNVLRLAFRKMHTFFVHTGRGTFNKHVGLFILNDRAELPTVEAADDAKKGSAEFVPLGELDPTDMNEDHWHLIMKMIGSMIGE